MTLELATLDRWSWSRWLFLVDGLDDHDGLDGHDGLNGHDTVLMAMTMILNVRPSMDDSQLMILNVQLSINNSR